MLGPFDPIFPVKVKRAEEIGSRQAEFRRQGFVSIWVGTFASVEDAEKYFGIPDEIGVYLPPEAFAADFGLGEFPPDTLEVNFEQTDPRPLQELLRDATFSASFLDQAVEAANRKGIREGQGVALLYDFDYLLNPVPKENVGALRFVGSFPFLKTSSKVDLHPFHELARKLGSPSMTVLFVAVTLQELVKRRRKEREELSGHVSAREYCEYLLACRGEDTSAVLRKLGLLRSEDVGRVMFGLVDVGLIRRQESDSEADFQGLFALE
jgi:uncharacterized repeat protein (TIGR04138 family)